MGISENLKMCKQIAGKSIVIYYSAVGGMKSLPFLFYFERIDHGLNYAAPYPIAQGIWDCFSHNIVRPVNISINQSTARCFVQSSLNSLATKCDIQGTNTPVYRNWI